MVVRSSRSFCSAPISSSPSPTTSYLLRALPFLSFSKPVQLSPYLPSFIPSNFLYYHISDTKSANFVRELAFTCSAVSPPYRTVLHTYNFNSLFLTSNPVFDKKQIFLLLKCTLTLGQSPLDVFTSTVFVITSCTLPLPVLIFKNVYVRYHSQC